jgi:hypothetical protein
MSTPTIPEYEESGIQYEDETDREFEREVKAIIESYTGWTLYKMPKRYVADFIAYNKDQVVALVEVRKRSNTMKYYKTFYMSLYKVIHILLHAAYLKVPAYLYIKWADFFGCIEVVRTDLIDIRQNNISKRQDGSDIEPTVHFPAEAFTVLDYKIQNAKAR